MTVTKRQKDWQDLLSLFKGNGADKLYAAAFFSLVFFCIWLPVRNVLDLPIVKIVPDLMILSLFAWYAVTVRFRFRLLLHDWLFLAFLAVASASSLLLNHIGILPIVFQIRSIGVFYILYFVVRNLRFGKREFTLLVDVLQVMTVVLFLFAAIEKITSKTVLFPEFVSEKILYVSNFARVYGLLANPNTYALFLVLVLFLSVFRRLLVGTTTSPVVYGLMVCSLLLTMSRSGALALGMGLLALGIYTLCKYRRQFPFKAFGVALAVTLIIGFGGYFGIKEGAVLYYDNVLTTAPDDTTEQTPPQTTKPSGDTTEQTPPENNTQTEKPTAPKPEHDISEDSVELGTSDRFDDMFSNKELANSLADGRLFYIKTGLEIVKDYPLFGAGFSAYGSAATLSFSSPIAKDYGLPASFYADNEYIKVLGENGLIGFALFGAFLLAALWCYRKSFFKVFLMFVLAWFGLFFNIFEVQIGTMLLWTMLAMHLPLESQSTEKRDLP